MNRKTIIGTLLVCFAAIVVSAPAIGTILTQQQLDNTDLSTYNFERIYMGKEVNESGLTATWGIKTLRPDVNADGYPTGDYIVVAEEIDLRYSAERYYKCREGIQPYYDENNVTHSDKASCLQKAKENIIARRNHEIEEERTLLISWQTKNQYNSELDDLDFE